MGSIPSGITEKEVKKNGIVTMCNDYWVSVMIDTFIDKNHTFQIVQ